MTNVLYTNKRRKCTKVSQLTEVVLIVGAESRNG